jgi:hypothetical protein
LEVVALVRHAHSEVADATPRVEPAMEGLQGAVGWRLAKPGEGERRYEEPAALIQHGGESIRTG